MRVLFGATMVWIVLPALTGQAAVSNPGFQSGGLADWDSEGTVDVETADGSQFYAVFRETGSGGLSRIYQTDLTFENDDPPPLVLSFRMAMHSDRKGRPSAVPPDSFTVFLRDSSGNNLIPPGASAPSYVQGLFYIDSDHDPSAVPTDGSSGSCFYDPSYVSVSGPDSSLSYTVRITLNATIRSETDMRLEFGFASGANGVSTVVVLDDIVGIGCGSSSSDPLSLTCAEETLWEGEGAHPTPAELAAMYGQSKGWPTVTGGCPPVDQDYADDINCGCPTVIFREWVGKGTFYFVVEFPAHCSTMIPCRGRPRPRWGTSVTACSIVATAACACFAKRRTSSPA